MRETFRGPLGVGDLVRVDTARLFDVDSVAGQVRSLVRLIPGGCSGGPSARTVGLIDR